MIELKNVSKVFKKKQVLSDVSFQINPNELVCIVGGSGVGKSTLIHLLAGAEQATSGSIEIDGVNLRAVPPIALRIFRQRVGVVFQDYKLLPYLTVAENIAFPLQVSGISDMLISQRVAMLIKQMKLSRVIKSLPRELSGGEKARTAIARAIVHKPMILLADEPTGNLDPNQSLQILKLFKAIHKEGTTVIIATHDVGLVDRIKARVLTLEDGRIVRDSAGGYFKPKVKKADEQVALSKVAVTTNKPADKKRKVRITAIRS